MQGEKIAPEPDRFNYSLLRKGAVFLKDAP